MDFEHGMKEGPYIEAKSAKGGLPKSIWETYSSFSNTSGGTIFIGVEEMADGSLIPYGLKDPDKTIKDFWAIVNNPQKVSVCTLRDADVHKQEIDGRTIVVVDVPRADRQQRPVYIDNNLNNGTFKRRNEGDYHCRLDEIREMMSDAGNKDPGLSILEEFGLDALDQATVDAFRDKLRILNPNHPWLEKPRGRFLELLGAAKNVDGTEHPTAAGLLMFGSYPTIRERFCYYFLDYLEIDDDDSRWSYRLSSKTGDWNGNVFTFMTTVLGRLRTRIGTRFELDGMMRKGTSEKGESAREAVVNALMNADYDVDQRVCIVSRPDSLKVINPGTFRIPIERAMEGGKSDPRNRTMMDMLLLIGYVENIGTGVLTMSEAYTDGELSYLDITEKSDPSRVVVEMGLSSTAEELSPEERAVLQAMIRNPRITQKMIATEIDRSPSYVYKVVSGLKSQGIVEFTGGSRNGRWIVRKQ